ncbi:alanyl-tRNA editing protein [Metabacillus sp. SLBN-84]
MTEKLYYTSPKTFEWQTEIVRFTKINGQRAVILKETAFYPEGGGQPSDSGTIGTIPVLDLIEVENELYHIVSEYPEGMSVNCLLDAARRMDHMQHHSGQHLLSAVCLELYGYETESFHLGAETVTIDLNTPHLSEDQMTEIENKANHYIFENRKIHTFFAGADDLKNLPLRKIPDVDGPLRIVQIDGIDTSACCGTHTAGTGEIGLMKLIKTEKQKGRIRLHFKCGIRALSEFQEVHKLVKRTARFFQSSQEEIPEQLHSINQELKQINKELEFLKTENTLLLTEKINTDQPGKLAAVLKERASLKDLQLLAAKFHGSGKEFVLLGSMSEHAVLFSQQNSIHAGNTIRECLKDFSGKGGGSEKLAQAKLADVSETEAFFQAVKMEIDRMTEKHLRD